MDALVSVLIPCYNAERWIGDTLRSVLGQTWPNIEVIVVDDGSRDGSFALAQTFSSKTVKVVRQPNQGAAAARNRAYSEAQGEFIQYLDADDLLSAEKIETQVELLNSSPVGCLAVSATMHFFDGHDPAQGVLHDGWPMIDSDNPREWLIDLYGPERGGMVQPGSWLTPRSVAEVAGPWSDELRRSPNDDGEYFARVVLASRGIRRSRRGLNYYRKFRDGQSLSGQRSQEHLLGALKALELMAEALLAGGKEERARQALARMYKDLAFAAYPFAPEVTRDSLARATELGFGQFQPRFPTRKGDVIARILGWRLARRMSVQSNRIRVALTDQTARRSEP